MIQKERSIKGVPVKIDTSYTNVRNTVNNNINGRRFYSSDSASGSSINSQGISQYKPVKVYGDLVTNKSRIVRENKRLSGVYIFYNDTTGKAYIGSSIDLSRRFSHYFSRSFLIRSKTMIIAKSLLKNNYKNFYLGILEFCDSDKCIDRENYYLDLFKPAYNVLKVAGYPPLYRKHSLAIRKKLSRVSPYAVKISFRDLSENKTVTFPSLKAACIKFGVKYATLKSYIRIALSGETSKPFLDRYLLQNLNTPSKRVILVGNRFNRLLVTDVTKGVYNQTLYPSIAAFAEAISTDPNNVYRYLSQRGFFESKNTSGEPRFYLGIYYIVELKQMDCSITNLTIPLDIQVTDIETGITLAYPAASVVAKVLNVRRSTVVNYFSRNNPKPINGKFTLKNLSAASVGDPNMKNSHIGPAPKLLNVKSDNTIAIKVIDVETSETFNFSSFAEAARGLGLHISSLQRYWKGRQVKPFKNKYWIKQG